MSSTRSLDFVRSRVTRAHPFEASCSLHLGIQVFFNIIHIRLNVFFKQQICIEQWFSTFLYRESAIHYSNPL